MSCSPAKRKRLYKFRDREPIVLSNLAEAILESEACGAKARLTFVPMVARSVPPSRSKFVDNGEMVAPDATGKMLPAVRLTS